MSSMPEGMSEADRARSLADLLARRGDEILDSWVQLQTHGSAVMGSVADSNVISARSRELLQALHDAIAESGRVDDPSGAPFDSVHALVGDLSRSGVRAGLSPAETAHGVLALREAIFLALQAEHGSGSADLNLAMATSGKLVDSLALLTFETYMRSREEVISRQNQQLLELSTPVVRLWDGVVAVPLIGTLDSSRAQVVMETLLQSIVDENATVAILDITGVPTVDTLVAQHLLKTVTATRLMGADCIISGIRPLTAQTIVQLGIDLADITTRSTLADALSTAIATVDGQRRSTAG